MKRVRQPGDDTVRKRKPWWGALLFGGVFVLGAASIAGVISIAKSSVTWTGGWPVVMFASAVATWGAALLLAVQAWDLVQIERHGADLQIERPDTHLLPQWLQWVLPFAAPIIGFLAGWKFS